MRYYTAEKTRENDKVVDAIQFDSDYVDGDGNIHVHVKTTDILITSKADLDNLTGYNPGSVAYTAGFGNMYQLDANSEWQTIIEEETEETEQQPEETGTEGGGT